MTEPVSTSNPPNENPASGTQTNPASGTVTGKIADSMSAANAFGGKVASGVVDVSGKIVGGVSNVSGQIAGSVSNVSWQIAGAASEMKEQVVAKVAEGAVKMSEGVAKVTEGVNKVADGAAGMASDAARNANAVMQQAKVVQTAVQETSFVTMESESDKTLRKNLFYVSAFIGFVWMLFHFTVVFFFGIELKSAALVGVFLGFGNLVSLGLDIPVSILQRYFNAKKLYIFAATAMLVAGLIFLKFIYASSLFDSGANEGIKTVLSNFLDSGTNILLLFVAAACYGLAKEINDITTLSYILNNSDPSEYSSIISKNNIFAGAGSLIGLVSSGFILTLNPTVAITVLIVFVVCLIGFQTMYFDNPSRSVDFSSISKLKVIVRKPNLESLKEYAVGYVSKLDFAAFAKSSKFVLLRPMKEKRKFNVKEIISESKKEAFLVKKVIAEAPFNFGMLWAAAVVLIFGFWDTFASSFLIEHLAKLSSEKLAYAMLGCIAIPAFVLQDPFISLSKKLGNIPVVIFGIVASGVSLTLMAAATTPFAFIALGLVNSIGYAAGMGISQWAFLDAYNTFYAKKLALNEIDSNASAAPMKIVQNLANVVGLTVGGILVAIFGFAGFFVIFGMIMLAGGVASFVYRKKINEA